MMQYATVLSAKKGSQEKGPDPLNEEVEFLGVIEGKYGGGRGVCEPEVVAQGVVYVARQDFGAEG